MKTAASTPEELIPPENLAEAGVWIARLHGADRGPELEAGFRQWLQASPMHARAFEAATDVWQEAGNLRRLIPLAPAPRSFQRRLCVALAAAAFAVVIVVGALFLLQSRSVGTGVGEQRTLNLEDGTHIFLNTDTRVVVRYDAKSRSVELQRGEALFNVAQHTDRPFVVTAGDRQVTALGTSFVVRRDIQHFAVTLVEGRVTVAPVAAGAATAAADPDGRSPDRLTLAVGERASFVAGQPVRMDRPELDKTLAWRRGQVVLDDMPLAAAVTEMNRYSAMRLAVERPEAARLPVNGLFQAGDSASFANAVALTYGLEVVDQGGAIVLSGIPTRQGLGSGPEQP